MSRVSETKNKEKQTIGEDLNMCTTYIFTHQVETLYYTHCKRNCSPKNWPVHPSNIKGWFTTGSCQHIRTSTL